jgi:hypothetical protein
MWAENRAECRPGPFRLQAVTPKGWGGPGRGTRLPDERLSLNNLTKPAAFLVQISDDVLLLTLNPAGDHGDQNMKDHSYSSD